jgi:amidophosphoribosyltransferase
VAASKEGNETIQNFECSVFNGEYPAGRIDADYLRAIEEARGESSKKSKAASG